MKKQAYILLLPEQNILIILLKNSYSHFIARFLAAKKQKDVDKILLLCNNSSNFILPTEHDPVYSIKNALALHETTISLLSKLQLM